MKLLIHSAVLLMMLDRPNLKEGADVSVENGTKRNCIVVTPHGPRDGGDFGPHTPGSKTSGLQEAFEAAKAQAKDVYISGGSWTESKTEPVVYFLQETLRIPWMQNFRCDSGNCVIHYSPSQGDAVVIDSQMSCTYRFGLIVSMSSGATVRLKPMTAGPDRFKVITSTDFYFNALVGGGGAWPSGEAYNSTLDEKRKWVGTGLMLDGSIGSIDANRIYVTEIVGCNRGIHLSGGCTHNSIEATSIHLSQMHVQLGDEEVSPARVRANRVNAHMEAQGIANAVGANIHGAENILTLSSEGMSKGHDIIFGKHAEQNLVTIAKLNGFSNQSKWHTNRVSTSSAHGLTGTPAVPLSGDEVMNELPWSVEIRIIDPGKVDRWSQASGSDPPLSFDGPLFCGQSILIKPGDRLKFQYSKAMVWAWRAVQ
ncbi:hypothetical protein K2Y11_00030 [bacterium]|nr:hypothetical protein [bacterium]